MIGDVFATIKEHAGILGLILGTLAAFFGSGWAGRWIVWTFLLTRKQQLKSLRKQQARLKCLHDTGGVSGWLLSGILWLLFLFGAQLTLEAIVAEQLTRSSPPGQAALLRTLLNAARYTVGFITMVVSINRLTWYRRLERYDTVMARFDDAIARLEDKLGVHQGAAAA